MRKVALWSVLIVAAVLVAGTASAAPSDGVVLKIGKSKPPVSFSHKAHGEKFLIGCAMCHHNNSAGAEQKCTACHGAKAEGKKLAVKDAFHTQCKGCHQKRKRGPVKCEACHKPGKKK